ncbi:MAG: formate dehydrogenase accessory sulfurtransferase FdhD [Pseudomonadota bacterium]
MLKPVDSVEKSTVGYRNVELHRRTPDDGVRLESMPIADEVAIEIHLNQQNVVVTMASPVDIEDLAVGFLVSEQYLERNATVHAIEVFAKPAGIIVNVRADPIAEQRIRDRAVPARASCGLCGVASLDDAIASLPPVSPEPLPHAAAIHAALGALREHQSLNAATRAVHGAAWCAMDGSIIQMREDIGRHNALDKLLGARVLASQPAPGFILITSRVSYELVQKAAAHGVASMVAISAPTTLSVDIATALGMNLIAIARHDNHSVFVAGDMSNAHA